MLEKICSICQNLLPATTHFFSKLKYGKFGLNSMCKKCDSKRTAIYRKENKEKIKIKSAQYYIDKKDKINSKNKEYRQNNKEKEQARIKLWKLKNIEHVRERNRKKKKECYKDPTYVLKVRLRVRLRSAFLSYSKTGKIRKSKDYFISFEDIIKYLGPCPGNIKDYHIDHIKPLSSFDFNDLEQVKIAFAPENHQWLRAEENLKKGDKILED